MPLPTAQERRAQGRALRQHCQRGAHAALPAPQRRADPLRVVRESNAGRVGQLVPHRHARMAASPFAFFRGTAAIQARDLALVPGSGIEVQLCGDCHIQNFGGFATPERALVFDLNDFDETHPGPFEWDLKRMATSIVLAGRERGLRDGRARDAAAAAVRAWREAVGEMAELPALQRRWARLTAEDCAAHYVREGVSRRFVEQGLQATIRRAQRKMRAMEMESWDATPDGPRFRDEMPFVFHDMPGLPAGSLPRETLERLLAAYAATLPPERRGLLSLFAIRDLCFKAVGVGSVGTRCYAVLLTDAEGNPLFLQVKEARASVLAGLAGGTPATHDGERVVAGQRLLQAASDPFLGWVTGTGGGHFYLRQLRDMKIGAKLEAAEGGGFEAYVTLCGRALGMAHARAGDPHLLAGYAGRSAALDEALARHAAGYADIAEADFAAFTRAIRQGRIASAEALPRQAA